MIIYNRIPTELKEDIISVIDFIEPRLPICPSKQQTYLFEIYNRFVASKGQEQNENCGACRSLVIGRLRTIVREWKGEMNSEA